MQAPTSGLPIWPPALPTVLVAARERRIAEAEERRIAAEAAEAAAIAEFERIENEAKEADIAFRLAEREKQGLARTVASLRQDKPVVQTPPAVIPQQQVLQQQNLQQQQQQQQLQLQRQQQQNQQMGQLHQPSTSRPLSPGSQSSRTTNPPSMPPYLRQSFNPIPVLQPQQPHYRDQQQHGQGPDRGAWAPHSGQPGAANPYSLGPAGSRPGSASSSAPGYDYRGPSNGSSAGAPPPFSNYYSPQQQQAHAQQQAHQLQQQQAQQQQQQRQQIDPATEELYRNLAAETLRTANNAFGGR